MARNGTEALRVIGSVEHPVLLALQHTAASAAFLLAGHAEAPAIAAHHAGTAHLFIRQVAGVHLAPDCLPTVAVPLLQLPPDAPFKSLCSLQLVLLYSALLLLCPEEIQHGVEVSAEELVPTFGGVGLLDRREQLLLHQGHSNQLLLDDLVDHALPELLPRIESFSEE